MNALNGSRNEESSGCSFSDVRFGAFGFFTNWNGKGNFAKSGDPNGPDLPKWPAFAENNQQAMVFTATPNAMPMPNLKKLKAFDAYMSWRREEAKKDNVK